MSKSKTYLKNIHTGLIDTRENWIDDYENLVDKQCTTLEEWMSSLVEVDENGKNSDSIFF